MWQRRFIQKYDDQTIWFPPVGFGGATGVVALYSLVLVVFNLIWRRLLSVIIQFHFKRTENDKTLAVRH